MPVSWTVYPVKLVNTLTASASLLTPHCTAFTLLDKSHSPRSRLRSEGFTLLACRTDPKFLPVSRPHLARCQAGLSRWPTVIWLTIRTFACVILALCTKQSSCCCTPPVWMNPSEYMISSIIVGTDNLAWGAGSGLISQHKPVNLPYSFKLSYSAAWSAVLGDREIATYFFGRGNILFDCQQGQRAVWFPFSPLALDIRAA